MFGWVQHMNFTRWVILVCLLLSAVGGWFVYDAKQRLAQLEEQAERAPQIAAGIIGSAHELQSLRKIASTRQDLDNLNSYITSTAAQRQIEIGSVDITSTKKDYGDSFEDEIFTIKPPRIERRPQYTRTKIANFAYMIERGTAVRVTRLRIFPPTHVKFKPHEVGPDLWTFEMEVRQRKRKRADG